MNEELLTAIGAALGQAGPYREWPPSRHPGMFAVHTGQASPVGGGNRVLAGAVDRRTRRVGWVEETVGEPQAGYVPVGISINMAGPGLEPACVSIATYNPFFGCDVRWIGFSGNALTVVYTEKHLTIAARLAPGAHELDLRPVGDDIAFADELACGVSGHGDVEVLLLDGLRPCVPLPCPVSPAACVSLDVMPADDGGTLVRVAEQLRADGPAGAPVHERGWRDGEVWRLRLPDPPQRGLPADPERFWSQLRAGLNNSGAPEGAADILIGAVATRYWAGTRPACDYAGVGALTAEPPDWFPAAWFRHLSASPRHAAAAARWLDWLQRLASAAPGPGSQRVGGWRAGWSQQDGAVQLALSYLRMRAAALARACRTGQAPAWWPAAWRDGAWAYPVPLANFPPGFMDAWERLPAEFRP